MLLRADHAALLQLRDNQPGLNEAGKWVFPGGHCESGEPIEACARREMREETGYQCGELLWLTSISHPSTIDRTRYRIDFFASFYDGVQPVHCYEGQSVAFVARGMVAGYPMPDYLLRVWDLAIANLLPAAQKDTLRENR